METLRNLVGEVRGTLSGWGETLFAHLPHLVVAALVMAAALLLGRWARKGLHKLLQRSAVPPTLSNLGEKAAQGLVLGLAVLICLGLLDLDKPLTSLLAGAGVAGIAIGFAFQNATANFISSVTLAIRRPYGVGDHVELGDVEGKVLETDLRVTRLRTFQGQEVRVPNKQVIENPIVNFSTGERRLDLSVGVGYDSDLAEVRRVTMAALAEVPDGRDPAVFFTGFGGSSIDLVCQLWMETEGHASYLQLRSDAIEAIARTYRQHGIDIPFPIRTLDLGGAVEQLQDLGVAAK